MEREQFELKEEETLEELGQGIYILQRTDTFRFGIDAVLLADFSSSYIKPKSRIAEIGTGTGVIPLLLVMRGIKNPIIAFEIQEQLAELAKKSVEINSLSEQITIVHQDIREQDILRPNSLDILICNPPYTPILTSQKEPTRLTVNPNLSKAISRHEITLNLDELFSFAQTYLKQGGKLLLIHRPSRFGEIAYVGKAHHLALKKARFIYPRQENKASMVLIELTKDGKDDLIVLTPLFIYEGENYTEEINRIYRISNINQATDRKNNF